jgi:hypothetical protein
VPRERAAHERAVGLTAIATDAIAVIAELERIDHTVAAKGHGIAVAVAIPVAIAIAVTITVAVTIPIAIPITVPGFTVLGTGAVGLVGGWGIGASEKRKRE